MRKPWLNKVTARVSAVLSGRTVIWTQNSVASKAFSNSLQYTLGSNEMINNAMISRIRWWPKQGSSFHFHFKDSLAKQAPKHHQCVLTPEKAEPQLPRTGESGLIRWWLAFHGLLSNPGCPLQEPAGLFGLSDGPGPSSGMQEHRQQGWRREPWLLSTQPTDPAVGPCLLPVWAASPLHGSVNLLV